MDVIDHKFRRNYDGEASNREDYLATQIPTIPLDGQEGAPAMIQRVLSYLQDGTIAIIGIYGMGGVGKTTLVKNVFNQVGGFDYMWFITVSKEPNYQGIQTSISRDLGISGYECYGTEERAEQVFQRLKERKYLLILDDVWSGFQLHELGIPNPARDSLSKVVIASRFLDVCDAMEADICLKVEVMFEDDAWKLFVEEAGSVVLQPSIEEIAREVLRDCGGLPLAIRTVGKAMRDKGDVGLWRSALRTLQESSGEIAGMKSEVLESLKLSFDHLDDATKNCFMYLSLFPENEIIFTYFLSVNWYLEGLIADVGDFNEVENKGVAVMSKLKDACLLESGNYARNVRMHDVVRDMALWIASSRDEPMFLTRTGPGVHEPPEEEEWEKAKRISLMRTSIDRLPEKPICPHLLTLMLEGNQRLTRIPSDFFQSMDALQILNLNRTGIASLPSSLSSLKNLRALYFYACKMLEDVEVVGHLHNLQVLDLYLTAVKELPESFLNLQNLKIL
ncbi:putative disease resistance protein, partial [Nymphaea thermarum]